MSDPTHDQVAKLPMDPVSEAWRVDALTPGLKIEFFQEPAFGAARARVTHILPGNGWCCTSSSFYEKTLVLLIWSWLSSALS